MFTVNRNISDLDDHDRTDCVVFHAGSLPDVESVIVVNFSQLFPNRQTQSINKDGAASNSKHKLLIGHIWIAYQTEESRPYSDAVQIKNFNVFP